MEPLPLLVTEPVTILMLGRASPLGLVGRDSWRIRILVQAHPHGAGPLSWSVDLTLTPDDLRDWERALKEYPFNHEIRLGGRHLPLLAVRADLAEPHADAVEHVVGLMDSESDPTAQVSFATTALPLTFAAHALELLDKARAAYPREVVETSPGVYALLPEPDSAEPSINAETNAETSADELSGASLSAPTSSPLDPTAE